MAWAGLTPGINCLNSEAGLRGLEQTRRIDLEVDG